MGSKGMAGYGVEFRSFARVQGYPPKAEVVSSNLAGSASFFKHLDRLRLLVGANAPLNPHICGFKNAG